MIGEGLRIAQHLRDFVIAEDGVVGSASGTSDIRIEPHHHPVLTRLNRGRMPQLSDPGVGIQVFAEYQRILHERIEGWIIKILDSLHCAHYCSPGLFVVARHKIDFARLAACRDSLSESG
ncbi:hypothetical protein D3C85_1597950 [compost metagenome]